MADVTFFPPTSILSNHSHHIYHPSPILPAQGQFLASHPPAEAGLASTNMNILPVDIPGAIPRIRSSQSTRNQQYTSTATTYLRSPFSSSYSSFSHRRRGAHIPQPPLTGCPLENLPDELWLSCFAYLPLEDLLRVRVVSKRANRLALHPSLHRSLTLLSLPSKPLPHLLTEHILPNLHHLHLHLFPFPSSTYRLSCLDRRHRDASHPTTVLLDLLAAVPPNQLRSLSLPFSAPYLPANELGSVLSRIGGKLEKLDLRGSGVVGSQYLDWMGTVGANGIGLKELDLGFTSISVLPGASTEDELGATDGDEGGSTWSSLTRLSLASCSSLSTPVLAAFLRGVPGSLESLDLSRLEQVTVEALWNMKVVHAPVSEGEQAPTALQEVKLVGIDHLTRGNIRQIKKHWEDQRRAVSAVHIEEPQAARSAWSWADNAVYELQRDHLASTTTASQPAAGAVAGAGASRSFSSWTDYEPVTPELSISSRSGSAASSSSSSSSSFGVPGSGSAQSLWSTGPGLIGPAARSSSSMVRGSVLSTHSALWSALARDDQDGMRASPGVWHSKLPSHPNLPSRYPSEASWIRGSTFGSCSKRYAVPDDLGALRRPVDGRELATFTSAAAAATATINITHSAILESEDEEGYRMFIGEVAGGVLSPAPDSDGGPGAGPGLGLGLGLEPGMGMDSGTGTGVGLGLGLGLGLGSGPGVSAASGLTAGHAPGWDADPLQVVPW